MDYGRQLEAREIPKCPPTTPPHALPTASGARNVMTRPLSDIKEITEPSLLDTIPRKPVGEGAHTRRPSKTSSLRREAQSTAASYRPASRQDPGPSRRSTSNERRSGEQSFRAGEIPRRTSSTRRQKRSTSIPRESAVHFRPGRGYNYCITNTAQSHSPVKEAADRCDPVGQERAQRVPSKTIIKVENASSNEILDHPTCPHPRLKVDLIVAAPLFVGGSSVEGTVRIIVDEADRVRHRKALTLERVSVDLFGIEEVSGARRNVFLSLGNELVDLAHPPPSDLVESQQPITPQERSWILVPSISSLPFLITLPLDVGPPPFNSKHARIRYVLCASLQIKDSGRYLSVRCTQETSVLSVYDPERALMSLPSPLTASDEYVLHRSSPRESIIATAGLHRQVWVSGTNIFADVHIVNNSHKTIKRLELQVERIVLFYRHAAAATLEMSASQHRIFDEQERMIAGKTVIKPGEQGWNGVMPYSSVLRTCELELPRGHATIKCNKYFEVRYYLNIIVSTTYRKVVTVQLPLILIHMNSLDVPTNSVAQVAAAIEEKRDRHANRASPTAQGSPRPKKRPSRVLQGRAFAAPRTQSLERARAYQEDLQELGRVLDASPRKHGGQQAVRQKPSSFSFKTPPSNRKGVVIPEDDAEEIRRRLGHVRFGSNVTNRSVPPSRNPPRASSALGYFLQESENTRPSTSIADSMRRPSLDVRKTQAVHDRWKPSWRDAKKDEEKS